MNYSRTHAAAGLLFGVGLLAAALAAAVVTPAAAQENVLLDYRDNGFRSGQAFYPPPLQARVAAAIKASPEIGRLLGDSFVILGDARGTFAKGGADQIVYLIGNRGPIAAEPFPEGLRQVLAVFRGGQVAGTFELPKEARYDRLVGTVDADRDGVDELLLESSGYNMGQSVTNVSLVKLGPGNTASAVQMLREVHYDGCDNPVGKKEHRVSTVAIAPDGKLTARSYPLKCG